MAKILLVEDDDRIAKPLLRDLALQNHLVDWACDGEQGWDFMSSGAYELAIVDVLLPKLDGFELCRRCRNLRISTPMLLLTALDGTAEKIRGLDAGADDYLVKPFELGELHARIRALVRRGGQSLALLHWGSLELDPNLKVARIAGHEVDLTTREYQLLELLLHSRGRTLSTDEILDRVWGWEAPGRGTVKSHLTKLRKKLAEFDLKSPIETLHGRGYRLADES